MEEIIAQLIQSQGIWAVLFVFLLLYTIKKNDKSDELQDDREKDYQKLLLELTDKFSIVNQIDHKLDNLIRQLNEKSRDSDHSKNGNQKLNNSVFISMH